MTRLISSSLLSVVAASVVVAVAAAAAVVLPNVDESDPAHWMRIGREELAIALNREPINKRAKNVILLIGDGMGVSTVTASRIYQGQRNGKSGEEGLMFFENFPNIAHAKTYNVDKQTPDSAATATAFLCGVKNNYGTIGIDSTVNRRNCTAQHGHNLTSILHWSQQAGKDVGVVTNTRITHATPAAAYAQAADRNWEADSDMAGVEGGCKDIARQLVEDNPDIKVILGGGRYNFMPETVPDPESGDLNGKRQDDRDLVQEWLDEKHGRNFSASYVWNATSFYDVDPNSTDFLLGLFAASHMDYEFVRTSVPDEVNDEAGEPSLAEMTSTAINMLSKGQEGFFLLVEGGRIDHAHHSNRAKLSLADTVAFDEAVRAATEMTSREDTLIVVTADHSHVFVIGGYPSRGNSITGEEDMNLARDDLPFTTLLYGNGPGYAVTENATREDITHIDVEDIGYRQQAAVPMASETHAGEDVAIYAQGPMAHLFHATHEQSYIAYVMAFASCVGPYANEEDCAAALEPSTPLPMVSTTKKEGDSLCPTNSCGVVKSSMVVFFIWITSLWSFHLR
ncbi:alkaline phosphatase-like [Littorina saxatilis]|uniref:Alkaline phosphatase, tissue-nonspecific isozyme n=1 Tax=Littorina saxatilis TaxID=31220 RepID=A0AAN9G530_9CAEN